ncbi:ATP-binding protein [Caulobacter segnis]|uniref:ATP-binding protein n=1 Tax=Caulobacter segnis TaxID=88688 RepID=UPI0024105173|nr:ATP-binding protein [Caulobacter segnis]MDG2522255.1 ATP-binding protein [Caulobacter segnis]
MTQSQKQLRLSKDAPLPSQELATFYSPVVRTYLLAVAGYYAIITAVHAAVEESRLVWILVTLSAIAVAACMAAWKWVCRPNTRLWRLEVGALVGNAALFGNVLVYIQTHPAETHKLVYFVLMAMAFATAGPSRRVVYASVALSLGSMIALAASVGPGIRDQYQFIGLAGAFAAIGMAALMRGAITREVRARLATEALNRQIEQELARTEAWRRRAHELALREQAANRAKTEFLATITHELRTPLNGVLGMAQAMAHGPLDATQRTRLETIRGSGHALLGLINTVLDISKIEAGRLELSETVFDLRAFGKELGDLYKALAKEKGLKFSLSLNDGGHRWRLGDEARLRQVLSNLLSNALKFTEKGSVTASITCDGDQLSCRVTDTGVGIAVDQSPRLFEKFVQADASTTRRFGGTGLGLAICKEIVSLMGGEIRFESTPGKGSCFSFEAPLPRADAEDVAKSGGEQAGLSDAPLEDLRVLVADDNATNRLVIQTLLRQFGVECALAEGGEDALSAWENEQWDMILMDIHMPRMDGLTATRRIRAAEKAQGRQRTPIVAITASVLSHETQAYLAAGMDDYIAKPIDLNQLLAAIERVLSGQGAGQAAAMG